MKIGATFGQIVLAPPSPDHPFALWISDVERLMKVLQRGGFSYSAFAHYYQGTKSYRMQPLVVMSRLAPMAGNLRFSTEILQLPVFDAMDLAYNLATVDHITEGRLDVGIGIGYNPYEIGPAGVGRKDRVPKFEESVELMRKFWTGEPVYHRGKYFNVEGTQLHLLPVQKPHPPLWGASYSHGAAARAGRTLEGIIGGPYQTFDDLGDQLETFRNEWHKVHSGEPTRVGAWRTIAPGKDQAQRPRVPDSQQDPDLHTGHPGSDAGEDHRQPAHGPHRRKPDRLGHPGELRGLSRRDAPMPGRAQAHPRILQLLEPARGHLGPM